MNKTIWLLAVPLLIVVVLYFVPFQVCLDGGSTKYYLSKSEVLKTDEYKYQSKELQGQKKDATIGQILANAGDLNMVNFDLRAHSAGVYEHSRCYCPILRSYRESYYLRSNGELDRVSRKKYTEGIYNLNESCSGCLILLTRADG